MTHGEPGAPGGGAANGRPKASFRDFVAWLKDRLGPEVASDSLKGVAPSGLFGWGRDSGVPEEELSRQLAEFCGMPHLPEIDRVSLDPEILPRPFCESKLVLPFKSFGKYQTVILSNPFDWELYEDLERTLPRGTRLAVMLAAPETIRRALKPEFDSAGEGPGDTGRDGAMLHSEPAPPRKKRVYDPALDPGKDHPVAQLANRFLGRAVAEGASHLRIEPHGIGFVVRATISGVEHDLQELPEEMGRMVVSRFKSLSGMDVAKRRTPQRGAMSIQLKESLRSLRLATAPRTGGEDLSIQILDPGAEAKSLLELGLPTEQARTLREMVDRRQGLILFVGSKGSGKTTTIHSLLSAAATKSRTVVTVEDPVELRIPFARQMEVGEEAGSTFDDLLRSAVEADPDVLYLNEIHDLGSATVCLEYAKAGHLVVASMDSSNSTTAIFRLERLGIPRTSISEALVGVVAQKLLTRLCPQCRKARPISTEESALLAPFCADLPAEVAHSPGCSACRGTGYQGQEGIFEILRVDPRIRELIAEGRSIAEIRSYARRRGDVLMGDYAIRKLRDMTLPVHSVYREILLEERVPLHGDTDHEADGPGQYPMAGPAGTAAGETEAPPVGKLLSILVVDDDESTRELLDRFLTNGGFQVSQASDGAQALLRLGGASVDLILSDINMPNLDGFKLLEIVQQQAIPAPVVLLTAEASPEVEERSREMGAADLLRKPISKEVLLDRIKSALQLPAE